ncbi:MAG: 30S ribosomal protein S2 [Ahrensia sp.]|nr:30S ribosomal protein S2 [Ahrensia sp.]
MALPDFSMRQLLEAGVHFGHQTHRWNPKMDRYIFGKRNNIHILDLSQTVPLLHTALKQISDTVAKGGRVLFVGTKRAASEPVADAARRSAQYYVNARWLGGMLTNWKTISNSIKRLRELEETLSGEANYTKKELLNLTRERDKLERALGGIKDMGGTPDLIFVIDTNKEAIAIQEARKLSIPVCAVLDSNSDTSNVDYPIPGNDDAARAIALYCDLVAKAAIDGIARQQGASGVDLGAQEEAPRETVLDDVTDTAKDVVTTATDATADTASAATDVISAAAASAAEMAGDAAAAVADTASSAAETVNEAAATSGPLFAAPEGEGDALTEIKGIGPVAEGQLKEQGITTFKQIAELTAEDIVKVDEYMPFSAAQIEDWQAQAKAKLSG